MNIQIKLNPPAWDYQVDSAEFCFAAENDHLLFLLETIQLNHEAFFKDFLDRNCAPNYSDLERFFPGGFLFVCLNKIEKTIEIFRDRGGIKTAYYLWNESSFTLNTNQHDLAKLNPQTSFDKLAIQDYFEFGFIKDGKTFYDDIHEVSRASELCFDIQNKSSKSKLHDLNLFQQDNTKSLKENINQLREQINKAHLIYKEKYNNVLLSGGIDSVAMLIAMDDVAADSNIKSYSYRVKGTIEDETFYANCISTHLNRTLEIIEIDPNQEQWYEHFMDKIVQMNNPYIGMWIFGNLKIENEGVFYAGQDSRLHTPNVNPIDRIAFELVKKRYKLFKKIMNPLGSFIIKILNKDSKKGNLKRHLIRLFSVFNTASYVDTYYFGLAKAPKSFNNEEWENFKNYFHLDYDKINNPRDLYNHIVLKKWNEQYVNDIRYLQDVARLNKTRIAMPFYTKDIVEFSSSIPFKWATKFMLGHSRFSKKTKIVSKYVLRKALQDKMDPITYKRSKAVSSTIYLQFNGALGRICQGILKEELSHKNNLISFFNFENEIDNYFKTKSWNKRDEDFLNKVYRLTTLIVYKNEIVNGD